MSVSGHKYSKVEKILTPESLEFLRLLHERFYASCKNILGLREAQQKQLDVGRLPFSFHPKTNARTTSWNVSPIPVDLLNRRVEITAPAERKMMINALNSGAHVFMADFEDSFSPTWQNVVDGQNNCMDAVRKTIEFRSAESKVYKLNPETAVLMIRPRGWHLSESHLQFRNVSIPASLFDFGLYFYLNALELIKRGSGVYLYLPKLESSIEAHLWSEVFHFSEDYLGVQRGSIRVTILIETVSAAFEMPEILYELREHACGLNAGRWDYIFSILKKFRNCSRLFDKELPVFPDRSEITMTAPFLQNFCRLLVQTCHRHGAQAIGGMAAFIPDRKNPTENQLALNKVAEDKRRESFEGFDGTWVAHPDLVSHAAQAFERKDTLQTFSEIGARDLLDFSIPNARVTLRGVRQNISVSLRYLESWVHGVGAVAISNQMEDVATAEISRAQIRHWIKKKAVMDNGAVLDADYYLRLRVEEEKICEDTTRLSFKVASGILDQLVLGDPYEEFLTVVTEKYLDKMNRISIEEIAVNSEKKQLDMVDRWRGIKRDYTLEDVAGISPSISIEYSLAKQGAEKLFSLLKEVSYVSAMGALTGSQAVQMVKAGLKSIYLSGWQVAADANGAGQTYPDQSLYPSNSVPNLVKRLNNALMRADQIEIIEGIKKSSPTDWYVPILADAEAGFGGPLHAFELMKSMIEAGASAVHFEDQLASEKKCGHLGGKVLIPTQQFIRVLIAARLASDVLRVPTLIVARTDALSATLLTSDIDERDRHFLRKDERTQEGYYRVHHGLDATLMRAKAYAPYADLLWFETSKPDIKEAQKFSESIHMEFPGKFLAYNCSPSFNWSKNLDAKSIQSFQKDLAQLGYKYQFITLAGWHSINLGAFNLSKQYAKEGMPAYVRLQEEEFKKEKEGYTAGRHQREVGTGYFDRVIEIISGGKSSTSALEGSTEREQFDQESAPESKKRAA